MTDGRAKRLDGRALRKAGRAMRCDASCPGVCVNCGWQQGAQEDVVITVDGVCKYRAGIYEWSGGNESAEFCWWNWFRWVLGAGYIARLMLVYCKASRKFCAKIFLTDAAYPWATHVYFGSDDAQSGCEPDIGLYDYLSEVTGITCNASTHKLEGAFDIPGTTAECPGATAHVTTG